jgi:hypothetical protein
MNSGTVADSIATVCNAQDGSTAFCANRETTSPAATILALLDDPSWPTESDKAIAAYELSRARVARQATLWGGQ